MFSRRRLSRLAGTTLTLPAVQVKRLSSLDESDESDVVTATGLGLWSLASSNPQLRLRRHLGLRASHHHSISTPSAVFVFNNELNAPNTPAQLSSVIDATQRNVSPHVTCCQAVAKPTSLREFTSQNQKFSFLFSSHKLSKTRQPNTTLQAEKSFHISLFSRRRGDGTPTPHGTVTVWYVMSALPCLTLHSTRGTRSRLVVTFFDRERDRQRGEVAARTRP